MKITTDTYECLKIRIEFYEPEAIGLLEDMEELKDCGPDVEKLRLCLKKVLDNENII